MDKTMRRRRVFFPVFFAALFQTLLSCNGAGPPGYAPLIPCPAPLAEKALGYAKEYAEADTHYEWGGQDWLRSIKVDCSGLIVNCYKYALGGTEYDLPFLDAAVIHFYSGWSVPTADPRPGDLIFMGDAGDTPTHISLFVKREHGYIYFIDSTLKPEDHIDGVSERHYPETDGRFLSFGILLLEKRPVMK